MLVSLANPSSQGHLLRLKAHATCGVELFPFLFTKVVEEVGVGKAVMLHGGKVVLEVATKPLLGDLRHEDPFCYSLDINERLKHEAGTRISVLETR